MMVEIRYIDNENNEPVIFDLAFPIKDYIPAKYLELAAAGRPIQVTQFADSIRPVAPELYFFIDLLDQVGLLTTRIGTPYIWSIHYEGSYKGTSFTMVYDEDYGFVSFAVSDSSKRQELAEFICSLVESQKSVCRKDVLKND
jgi:hypothetical protein